MLEKSYHLFFSNKNKRNFKYSEFKIIIDLVFIFKWFDNFIKIEEFRCLFVTNKDSLTLLFSNNTNLNKNTEGLVKLHLILSH